MSLFRKKEASGAEKPEKQAVVTKRNLTGALEIIATAVCVVGVVFQLYNAGFGAMTELQLRAFHWMYIGFLGFLLYGINPSRHTDKVPVYDIIFAVLTAACCIYLFFSWDRIARNFGFITTMDTIVGIVLVLLVLELTRRAIGIPLVIVSLIFLAYAFFGGHISGIFASKDFTLNQVVRTLFASTDGIFGMPIGVSASYVVLFILFGSFLQESGGGELFTDVAFGLVGRFRGGPAKSAVVSSCLFGMISGAAVANVVTTGTFTIPLMKKGGYKSHFAGAVEAVASCGGQFMPPIMGAAAFMIATNCDVAYGIVAVSALVPALLYYFYLFICLDAEAKKNGLKGLEASELPSIKTALKKRGHMLIPLVVLIFLLVSGYSPGKSVFWSIILLIATAAIKKDTRMGWKSIVHAIQNGVYSAAAVAIACACAVIISGVISLTGLGLRFSSILIQLSGGNLLVMLLLTMLAAIIMGMGLPTSAAYVILAVLTSPALIELGVTPLAAHFFIFFFACISTITPPVALSAYAGAGIAGSDPMKTGWTAFTLGLAGYIVPFLAVYKPSIMLIGTPFLPSLIDVSFSVIAVISMTFTVSGFLGKRKLPIYIRIAFAVLSALIFLDTGNWADLIATIGIIALWAILHILQKKDASQYPPIAAA